MSVTAARIISADILFISLSAKLVLNLDLIDFDRLKSILIDFSLPRKKDVNKVQQTSPSELALL